MWIEYGLSTVVIILILSLYLFLGKIPISIELREASDLGLPLTYKKPEHDISKVFLEIASKIKQDFV